MAWINDKYGFIHIPRTGGTSLVEILKQNGWERIGHEHSPIFHVEKGNRKWFTIMRDQEDWIQSMQRFISFAKEHYDHDNAQNLEDYKAYFDKKNKEGSVSLYSDLYLYPNQYIDKSVKVFNFLDWGSIFKFIDIPKPQAMPHLNDSHRWLNNGVIR